MAKVKVGELSEFGVGQMRRVACDDVEVALVRLSDAIVAVSDVCTHAGESLANGWLEGDLICCPKHGGKFELRTGKAVAFPAVAPLERYRVTVDGDDIYVDVDD